MSRSFIHYIILFIVAVMPLLTSCHTTKYVPPRQALLNRVKIKSDVKGVDKDVVRMYIRQKPNTGILGRIRLQLAIYNLSGRDTSKWINRKLKNAGEPPVIFSNEDLELSRINVTNLFKNKGYHDVEVKTDTIRKGKRNNKMNVTYTIHSVEPYRIGSISYDFDDDTLRAYMRTYNFIMQEGDRFDLDQLQTERTSIVSHLRNSGFYYFSKDHIYAEADSTIGEHKVDVVFKSRPFVKMSQDGNKKEYPNHIRVKIRDVNVYPWEYSSNIIDNNYNDTVSCGHLRYYYHRKRVMCPSFLYMKIFTLPGEYFSVKNVDRTNTAIGSLGTTKYVNVYFRPVEGTDSLIDCFVSVTPNRVQSYSLDVEGTNTDGDLGAALNATYSHKNLFRGAEALSMKLRLGYLPMGGLKDALSDRSLEVGGEVALTFPRFMAPLLSEKLRRRIRASTEFNLSYNYQTTPWYDRNIFNAGIDYNWTTGSRDNESYSFKLLDLSYVYLPTISEYFRRTYIDVNSIVRYSYEDHIIMALGFTFSRNTKRNAYSSYFSYRGTIETAGNLLYGICALSGISKDKDGFWRVLDIRYSQYVKGEFGYSFNHVINEKNTVVYHFNVGIAYPYGNADVVPFEKRFYSGGANSVRGWSIRSLGPGVYKSGTGGTDFNQSGDIKLDLNLEYRFKLFWILEGAAFIDAGNIWTINDYNFQKGGKFYFSKFYKQLAVAYGLGLRFDFSFFLVRFDVGAKLFDPVNDGSARWRRPLKWKDTAFHIAIGYPF